MTLTLFPHFFTSFRSISLLFACPFFLLVLLRLSLCIVVAVFLSPAVLSLTAADSGSGYLEGHCEGNTLKIFLHNSKAMTDFSMIQWAAASSGQWAQNHGMHSCDDEHCRLTDNDKTVEVSIPNSHGLLFPFVVLFFFFSFFFFFLFFFSFFLLLFFFFFLSFFFFFFLLLLILLLFLLFFFFFFSFFFLLLLLLLFCCCCLLLLLLFCVCVCFTSFLFVLFPFLLLALI